MATKQKINIPLGRILVGVMGIACLFAGIAYATGNNNNSTVAAKNSVVVLTAATEPGPYNDAEVQRLQGAIGLALQLDQELAPCADAALPLPAPVPANAPESVKANYRAALQNIMTSYLWDAVKKTDHCQAVQTVAGQQTESIGAAGTADRNAPVGGGNTPINKAAHVAPSVNGPTGAPYHGQTETTPSYTEPSSGDWRQ